MFKLFQPLVLLVLLTELILSVPAAAQLLLMENFNDGVADLFIPIDPSWQVVDGVYQVHTEVFNHYALAMAGNCSWRDYVFEFDIMTEGSPDQVFFVRMQDADNFYEINVRGNPWGDAYLFKWVDGIQHFLYSAPFSNEYAQWNHMKVVVSANEIGVVLGNDVVFTYADTDSPWLCGGIGLVGHCGFTPPYQDAHYDNVLVTAFDSIPNESVTWAEIKNIYR